MSSFKGFSQFGWLGGVDLRETQLKKALADLDVPTFLVHISATKP